MTDGRSAPEGPHTVRKRPLNGLSEPHWSDAWIGRSWISGEFECWDLVVAVRFALGHPRPADAAWAARARGAGRLKRAALLDAAAREGSIARPLAPGEAPREGDGLSMREGGGVRASHAGVLLAMTPGGPAEHVLHCLPGLGVVRHRIDALAAANLVPAAVWRFRC